MRSSNGLFFSSEQREMKVVSTQQADRFIYVVGEQQCAIIPESAEVFSFTGCSMQQIDTGELASVVANVFGKGQFFPGPAEVLTSVVHELTGRSAKYQAAAAQTVAGRCTLITAFKRLDEEVSVKVAAIIAVGPGTLNIEEPESFHALLVEKLPDFQQVFTEEAYALDSKIFALIKETALHHINKELQ